MKKKIGGPFYSSTRVLKVLAYIVFVMGLLAAKLTIMFAWPTTNEKMIYYGFYIMVCFIEIAVSFVMALLIYVFADMLDCLFEIQENTNEICAVLKKKSEPVESADAE